MTAGYGWTINQRDAGGPYLIGESEGWFSNIESAVEDARANWDDYDGPEFIQIFREPGGSFDDLVAGWNPMHGLELF